MHKDVIDQIEQGSMEMRTQAVIGLMMCEVLQMKDGEKAGKRGRGADEWPY